MTKVSSGFRLLRCSQHLGRWVHGVIEPPILPLHRRMNHEQAEAGPSKPRTPPDTPETKSRRRSWFGLVTSPFASTAPASSSGSSPRRKSFADDEAGHELTERSSKSSLIDPSLSPAGRSGSMRRSKGTLETAPGEEVLTIDGQVETPTSVRSRRKKKWRSTGLDEEQGETVRLEDLSLRRGSSRSTLRPSQEAVRDTATGSFPHQNKVSVNDTEMVLHS